MLVAPHSLLRAVRRIAIYDPLREINVSSPSLVVATVPLLFTRKYPGRMLDAAWRLVVEETRYRLGKKGKGVSLTKMPAEKLKQEVLDVIEYLRENPMYIDEMFWDMVKTNPFVAAYIATFYAGFHDERVTGVSDLLARSVLDTLRDIVETAPPESVKTALIENSGIKRIGDVRSAEKKLVNMIRPYLDKLMRELRNIKATYTCGDLKELAGPHPSSNLPAGFVRICEARGDELAQAFIDIYPLLKRGNKDSAAIIMAEMLSGHSEDKTKTIQLARALRNKLPSGIEVVPAIIDYGVWEPGIIIEINTDKMPGVKELAEVLRRRGYITICKDDTCYIALMEKDIGKILEDIEQLLKIRA